MSLSSDQPRTDPKEDLFGHAPFAEQLARSIGRYAAESGLVLALHGPWGSGKSTVLGYVRHYLAESSRIDRLGSGRDHFIQPEGALQSAPCGRRAPPASDRP